MTIIINCIIYCAISMHILNIKLRHRKNANNNVSPGILEIFSKNQWLRSAEVNATLAFCAAYPTPEVSAERFFHD